MNTSLGSDYKTYRVAVERAQNQLLSKGYDVATAGSEDKLYHELLLDCFLFVLIISIL